jgi:hypothetical protein
VVLPRNSNPKAAGKILFNHSYKISAHRVRKQQLAGLGLPSAAVVRGKPSQGRREDRICASVCGDPAEPAGIKKEKIKNS